MDKITAKDDFLILRLAPVLQQFGGIDTSMIKHDNEICQKCEIVDSGHKDFKPGDFVLAEVTKIFEFDWDDEKLWLIHYTDVIATCDESDFINTTGGYFVN